MAKYSLTTVFSDRLHLDNLTSPEYNSVKQSPMCLFLSIMYNHIQDFIAAHQVYLLGVFVVLMITHESTRIDGCRICGRLRTTTGADHDYTTIFTKNFVKERFIFTRKIKFTFLSEICKNRAKISKIFNLIFGVKF